MELNALDQIIEDTAKLAYFVAATQRGLDIEKAMAEAEAFNLEEFLY